MWMATIFAENARRRAGARVTLLPGLLFSKSELAKGVANDIFNALLINLCQ
jgi:hypothetical protein